MRFKAIIGAAMLLVPAAAFADIKLARGLELGTVFYFKTDQDRAMEEYFSMGAKAGLEYEVQENWEFALEADFGTDAIRLDEVWGKYKFENTRLKIGMFENTLVVDDLLPGRLNIYADNDPVRERLDDMGWYSPGAVGFRFYRTYKGDGAPFEAFAHLSYQASAAEVQYGMGAYWAYAGVDSWLGLAATYFPYFIHDLWTGEGGSYTQDHNFLFNAVFADFSGGFPLVYKAEFTIGNNLTDPVGYVHFPGDGEVSWFFGASGYAGFPLGDEKGLVYTPGLLATLLIHQLDIPESNTVTVRTGHKMEWRETFAVNLDLGLGINTYYSPNLLTALEILWGIAVEVRI